MLPAKWRPFRPGLNVLTFLLKPQYNKHLKTVYYIDDLTQCLSNGDTAGLHKAVDMGCTVAAPIGGWCLYLDEYMLLAPRRFSDI